MVINLHRFCEKENSSQYGEFFLWVKSDKKKVEKKNHYRESKLHDEEPTTKPLVPFFRT